ncbi:hypothetical protein Hanom_Chr01g00000971 [Helianthus anomalus]
MCIVSFIYCNRLCFFIYFSIVCFKSCSLCNMQLGFRFLSKLQVLSFTLTPFCRRCPLAQKLTSYVLNVSKYCTLCPLALTQLYFLVNYGHVLCT